MAYLYRHIRLDKNEVFYIGIGVGRRAWQKYHRNIHWKRVVSKSSYFVEIVLDGLTWEAAVAKEMEFIKLYGRRDKGEGSLVNMTDGGEGMIGYITPQSVRDKISAKKKGVNPRPAGWKMTEEGKINMSLANKGKQKSLGRKLSQKTKDKISKSLMGSKPTNNKPVVMYSLRGAFIAEYESANEASRNNMCLASNITSVCSGRSNSFMGFLWKYRRECVDKNGQIVDKIKVKIRFNRRKHLFRSELEKWNFYRISPNIN